MNQHQDPYFLDSQFISIKDVLEFLALIELCFDNDWTVTHAALCLYELPETFLDSKEETGSSNLDCFRAMYLRLVEKSGLTRDQIFDFNLGRSEGGADELRH